MAKVLIVEDDRELTDTIVEWLNLEHHSSEAVDNGIDANAYLIDCIYDLVILDWNLPGMSGLDVLKQFRARGGVTPILMLTGKDAVKERTEGLDSGADDYLTKPFHPEELMSRIRALLRRPVQYFSNAINLSKHLQFDPVARRLKKSGETVALQPLEYDMLNFFLRHPNEVFSVDSLLLRIWDSTTEASLDAVYSCIKRLRQKLHVEGETPLITTVHRAGYRFDLQS